MIKFIPELSDYLIFLHLYIVYTLLAYFHMRISKAERTIKEKPPANLFTYHYKHNPTDMEVVKNENEINKGSK